MIAVSVSSQIGENSCLGNKGERKMHLIRCMYFLVRPELTLKSVAFRLQNKACYYAKDGKSTESEIQLSNKYQCSSFSPLLRRETK